MAKNTETPLKTIVLKNTIVLKGVTTVLRGVVRPIRPIIVLKTPFKALI
jgi:hypothetical protein